MRARRAVRVLVAAAALAVLVAGLVACSRGGGPSRDGLQEALSDRGLSAREARGKRLFAERCATCHGSEGRGDGQNASRMNPAPGDMSVTLRQVTPDTRRRIVIDGSAAVSRSALCPPRRATLRPEDVDALLAWLDVAARLPPAAEPGSTGTPRWRRRPTSD